jgi:hypothetical protein
MAQGRLPSSYCPIVERAPTVAGRLAYTPRPMTNRTTGRRSSRTTATSRAEARRRARVAAQDNEGAAEEELEAEPASRPTGGFIQRLFPAAPPLKGKGDPLADFHYEGRFRSIVAALYLLRKNPWAWLPTGALWLLASQFQMTETLILVGTIVQYGALAAAGWFGWQRPWLYGVAGAMVGWIPFMILLIVRFAADPASLVAPGATPPTASQLALYFGEQTVILASLGFIAGWYGGYLRRRLATPTPAQSARARRR